MEWSLKQWCEFYQSIGWILIPVKNKTALCKWGSVDPDMSQYYNKDIDIAVATGSRSGVIAIDIDGVRGQENEKTKTFIKMCEETGTRKFKTKSENWQYLFKNPQTTKISNGRDIFNTGASGYQVDIRGTGGLTVIPPSKGYAWINDNRIVDATPQILSMLRSEVSTTPRRLVADLPEKGNRHDWFMSEVASAFAKGWTFDKVMTHFCTLNKGLDEPLENVDLEGLIQRIYKMHISKLHTNIARKNVLDNPIITKNSDLSESFNNGFGEILKEIHGTPEPEPEFTTGFETLDKTVWGYSRGHLTVLSGVSEAGKSMLAQMSFLKNIERGKKCLMFSAELSKKDVYKRLLIHTLHVPSSHFNSKTFTPSEIQSIEDQIQRWQSHSNNMMICAENLSPKQIISTTQKEKPDIIYIDYWQNLLFDGEGHMYMTRAIQDMCTLAKELNIPVVILSQLKDQYVTVWNREQNKSERQKIDSHRGDIKMTMALVQSADVLITLNYRHDENAGLKSLRVSVDKNKVTGKVRSMYYMLDSEILQYRPIEQNTYYGIGK